VITYDQNAYGTVDDDAKGGIELSSGIKYFPDSWTTNIDRVEGVSIREL
jgi:hypothetical protein